MAWSLVANSGAHNESTTSTFAVTLGAACVTDDRVTVVITPSSGTANEAVTSVTGTFCGTFTQDASAARTIVGGFDTHVDIWSAPVTSNGTPVVTIGFTGSQCGASAAAFRSVSNAASSAAVDTSGTGVDADPSAASWSATTSGSTTAANELVVVGYGDDGEGVTPTAGSSGITYTIPSGATNAPSSLATAVLEYGDSGASGSTKTGNGTTGSTAGWVVAMVVYKLAAGGDVSTALSGSASTGGSGTGVPNFQIAL